MLKKPTNFRISMYPVLLTACGVMLFPDRATVHADDSAPPAQGQQTLPTDTNSTSLDDEHAEDESPSLGVVVGSCPGDAVCIKDTVWGSPADEAGLREGDYILSVNGEKVTSPKRLKQVIEKLEPGAKVNLTLWRSGQETEQEVTLASKAEQPPASHRAWLGVMLSPADDKGVMVERVLPGSPAAQAGLKEGDTIVKQGDKPVTDILSFIESIEDQGPNSKLQLTVIRNGSQQQMPVTLGDKDQAPMRFIRQVLRPLSSDWRSNYRSDDSNEPFQMMEETIDQMREQIRELQRQVRELQGDSDLSLRSRTGEPGRADAAADQQTLVVQRRQYDRNRYRSRSWDNDYYSWRDRNYRRYRTPLYRSPYSGNSYYRYRGRPYYGNFGPGYRWGRSGVQLGNFGVYWY